MTKLAVVPLAALLIVAPVHAGTAVRLPESSRNFLRHAQVSGNLASFHKGVRGNPVDVIYDMRNRRFVKESEFHEYGVGFGQELGVVPEDPAAWWMAKWAKPIEANLIVLSGVYDNQPQPDTAWKIELHRDGKWVTHARGVGGWYNSGRYQWGGPKTPPIVFDGLRVSVFSKDRHTQLKSIHFRGEPGISWVVTYCPPIDAQLKFPDSYARVGSRITLRAIPVQGKIANWQWDFGDGHKARGREVNHVFEKPGSYRVRLHFSDDKHTAFRSGTITVIPPFSMRIKSPTSVLVGEPLRFESKVRGDHKMEHAWLFGDGATARWRSVQHIFRKPGVYHVSLHVSNGVYADKCRTMIRVLAKNEPQGHDTIPVWIDTDIGGDIDDAVCLLLAARDPRIEIVGVSTVRGCIGAVDVAAWLCREILKRSGFPQVPVLPGAVASFSGKQAYPNGVGSYGELAPPPQPVAPAGDAARIQAIAKAMQKIGKPFHLVTIGPLTNAAWIVEHHPKVAKQWLTVTCMAGQLNAAECNVRLDATAARIVCEKLHPRLVAMEAIGPAIPRKEADAALDPADPASAFLLECYAHYRAQADWSGVERERRPLTVFDPTTLLSLVRPDAFEIKPVHLRVEKDGQFHLADDGPVVNYAFSSDWHILKPLLIARLRGAELPIQTKHP